MPHALHLGEPPNLPGMLVQGCLGGEGEEVIGRGFEMRRMGKKEKKKKKRKKKNR